MGTTEKNRLQREYRADKKARGECTRCTSPSIPGKVMCAACADANRTKHRAQRKERKAAGLCRNCKEPATHGTLCLDHRLIQRADRRQRRFNAGIVPRRPQPPRRWRLDVSDLPIDRVLDLLREIGDMRARKGEA